MKKCKLSFNELLPVTRSQRRKYAHYVGKKLGKRIKVPPLKSMEENYSFIRIKPDLEKLGWKEGGLENEVEHEGILSISDTPVLKLVNEKFDISLIPQFEGIEISRLGVKKEYRGQGLGGRVLNAILNFLIKHGVEEIYVYPGVIHNNISENGLHYYDVERMYLKRGFIQRERIQYWKLDVNLFLTRYPNEESNNILLS